MVPVRLFREDAMPAVASRTAPPNHVSIRQRVLLGFRRDHLLVRRRALIQRWDDGLSNFEGFFDHINRDTSSGTSKI